MAAPIMNRANFSICSILSRNRRCFNKQWPHESMKSPALVNVYQNSICVRPYSLNVMDAQGGSTSTDSKSVSKRVRYLPWFSKQRCICTSNISRVSLLRNNYSSLADRECWNCGRKNGFEDERFFCKCGIIQEVPDDITYFDILGVEKTFDLDLSKLRRHYMQSQMKLHPDKYSQKSDQERQLADEQSSMVNKAYFTLLKPLSRGLYLLEQHGEALEEGTAPMDNEFLMEIMELNEQIAEVESKDTVIQLGKDNLQMLQKMEKKLSKAFADGNIALAKDIVQEMKYYDNLDRKIKELEQEQGIVF